MNFCRSVAACCTAVCCIITMVGCKDADPSVDYPIEREVNEALSEADQLSYDDEPPRRISVQKIRAELASFGKPRPIEAPRRTITFGDNETRPQTHLVPKRSDAPPFQFVQAPSEPPSDPPSRPTKKADPPRPKIVPSSEDEDAGAGASASDLGPVEVIPTPRAQPEIRAEMVPTPLGIPASKSSVATSKKGIVVPPVAHIASDPNDATKTPAGALKDASKVMQPKATELIDVTSEMVAEAGGPEDYNSWPNPEAMLFITGDQHGYLEPCGCTGLDRQKGGLARRFTFLKQLRDKNLNVVPIDAGNQIRRIGPQANIKFERSAAALTEMEYQAVGLGPGDMRISAGNLIQVTYADDPEDRMFIGGNVVLLDPEFLPTYKVIARGEWKIGVTSILDPKAMEAPTEEEVTIGDPKAAAEAALVGMNADGANFRVITFYGKEAAAKKLMKEVAGYDLVVVAGSYGEPTYRPQTIDGSRTQMIVTGNKGMYVGLVGLYANEPLKYSRVPLTHEFSDSPEMRKLMADYQQQLELLDLKGLGLEPIPHPSGNKFVGSETCGKCHTEAFDVWESSAHFEATDHIVEPTEGRGDVPRHFDPECISCHVTGWNPQGYYPYESGYLDLENSQHLVGNGCENCHGPGAEHSAAEEEDSSVSEERRKSLRLAIDRKSVV